MIDLSSGRGQFTSSQREHRTLFRIFKYIHVVIFKLQLLCVAVGDVVVVTAFEFRRYIVIDFYCRCCRSFCCCCCRSFCCCCCRSFCCCCCRCLQNEDVVKVTVDLRGVFWGKQHSALCINGKYINLYIIGELI